MRKVFLIALVTFFSSTMFAQNDSATRRKILKPATGARSNDHFLLQVGYTTWTAKPDSINTSGFSRSFNAYFLFDFPFKTNPKWSVAVGPGIATDNVYFDNMMLGIKESTPMLRFQNVSDTNSFKKYKLLTAYLEAPVELRFSSRPDDNKHSVKVVVGAKVGTLVSAGIKGKTLEDKNGNTLLSYTLKEKSKRYFNQNRLSVTGRLGYGHFSLFGSYSVTPLFKEGNAPAIRPLTIGITISGL